MATATDRKMLQVRLLTPEGAQFDDEAVMVIVPGVAGELGLLARHEPLVTSLRFGEVRIHAADETVHTFATTDGYASIGDDRVFILVEQAEKLDAIDVARAEKALSAAQAALEAASDDTDKAIHRAAVRRNENRVKVAQKSR